MRLTSGRRIAFVDQTQATNVFNKVAHSLVSGPLSQTKAWQVRVRTLPVDDPQDDKPRQSNIEVLLPDIYDEEAAREVCLVRNLQGADGRRQGIGHESAVAPSRVEASWSEA